MSTTTLPTPRLGSRLSGAVPGLRPLWTLSPLLTGTGFALLALTAAFVAGAVLDPREIMGAPRWMKPAKFAVSTGIYALTFGWLLTHLRGRATLVRRVATITAVVLALEVALIALQAGRGTTSHFNQTTTLNGWITLSTGVAILTLWVASIVVAVAVMRQRFESPALSASLRWGLGVTILGAAVGIYMAAPTSSQMDTLRTGVRPAYIGAHSVGGADGGPGVPVVNWSTEHGDLRVPHFVGLHALQVLPLLGWALARSRRRSDAERARLLHVAGASYAGLTAVLFWQALRGQPVLEPDALTWAALGLWAALTTGAAVAVTRRGVPHGLSSPGRRETGREASR